MECRLCRGNRSTRRKPAPALVDVQNHIYLTSALGGGELSVTGIIFCGGMEEHLHTFLTSTADGGK
jgi:hypothetical protein